MLSFLWIYNAQCVAVWQLNKVVVVVKCGFVLNTCLDIDVVHKVNNYNLGTDN